MKIAPKLLLALMAGALVVSFADGASATKRLPKGVQVPAPVADEGQTPPSRAPRQFFPEKRIQPLTPEIEQSLIPKDSFKECDVCPEMVVVPKGSFMMGTPITEVDRAARGEDPLHRVSFAKPFAVGRFTISFDEWDVCLADGGCGGIKGDDKGFGHGRGGGFLCAESVWAVSGSRQRLGLDRGLLQQALHRGHAGRRRALARGRLPPAHDARWHLELVAQHGAFGLSPRGERRF